MKLSEWELARLETVAQALAPVQEKVVFLGGSIVGLLLTDRASPPVRPTKDVDVLVETVTYGQQAGLESRLRSLGFEHDQSEGAPICRWLIGDVKVDVMPSDASALGFSNRWYPEALRTAIPCPLRKGIQIALVSPACFLATKLEAFSSRGNGDYLESEFTKLLSNEAFLQALPGHLQGDEASQGRVPHILRRFSQMSGAVGSFG